MEESQEKEINYTVNGHSFEYPFKRIMLIFLDKKNLQVRNYTHLIYQLKDKNI